MLQENELMAAVSRINQRSERQENLHKLVGTYVDVGLLPQLHNSNHQIFYGRRGTGKTHVIKVLESKLQGDVTNTVVYIDCRTLGSTAQFTDDDVPLKRRCLSLFRDFLLAIYQGLLEHIIEQPSVRANDALREADRLSQLITEPLTVLRAERVKTSDAVSRSESSSNRIKLAADLTQPSGALELSSGETNVRSGREDTEYAVEREDKVIFPELQSALSRVLTLAESRLYVLIDEWSSLPLDIQPFLAEFLKRGLLPLNAATLKIGALEYRCRFSERQPNGVVGFELGADIATAPDLDDYFVFDRNPDQVIGIYEDVLYRHLNSGPIRVLSG